ncbi:nucleotidyltransferase family protein [Neptuniibacter halophilus]|uniref:nucleotidyltransferase family protein n=1 Tax=Neptuniibacter halophilus TaxID=651666 RepID=UPI002573982F|nr:nucleotidyltransferase family protein [Neptuniibacter halophilus]
MIKQWRRVLLNADDTIREALEVLGKEALRFVLVTDSNDHLLGIVTDGDVRRGLLNGITLQDQLCKVMNKSPITAPEDASREYLVKKMNQLDILAIPLMRERQVVGVETLHHTVSEPVLKNNPVFIMAGGFGKRLRPLTDNCPKPMLLVGDKPLLEHQINRFICQGFHNFYISTHYLPEMIRNHFGDGRQFGVSIKYVHERSALGTGGALGLLPKDMPELPLIMVNGDVLTDIDYVSVLKKHDANGCDATVCVREVEHQVAYGVVETDQNKLLRMVEKPVYRYLINTGIYVLSALCVRSVKSNEKVDMPNLIERRMESGFHVGVHKSNNYWLDIGQMADYRKAQEDILELTL